jgi:hypothetical protein
MLTTTPTNRAASWENIWENGVAAGSGGGSARLGITAVVSDISVAAMTIPRRLNALTNLFLLGYRDRHRIRDDPTLAFAMRSI